MRRVQEEEDRRKDKREEDGGNGEEWKSVRIQKWGGGRNWDEGEEGRTEEKEKEEWREDRRRGYNNE